MVKMYSTMEWMFYDTTLQTLKLRDQMPGLSKIAEVVLIISHSNAELERLFSLVKKKSLERSSMKLDGKLSSILAMKTKYPESSTPCYH